MPPLGISRRCRSMSTSVSAGRRIGATGTRTGKTAVNQPTVRETSRSGQTRLTAVTLEVHEHRVAAGELRQRRRERGQQHDLDGDAAGGGDAPDALRLRSIQTPSARARGRRSRASRPARSRGSRAHGSAHSRRQKVSSCRRSGRRPYSPSAPRPLLKRGGLRRQRDRLAASQLVVQAREVLEQDRPRDDVAGQVMNDDQQAPRPIAVRDRTARPAGSARRRDRGSPAARSATASMAGPTSSSA